MKINVHVCISVQVRFSALVMLLELASKLKENYMVLLPETIPFLAELMEGKNITSLFNQIGTQDFVTKVHSVIFVTALSCVLRTLKFVIFTIFLKCSEIFQNSQLSYSSSCFSDECEEVEHQVQKVIHEMENVLGESLQSYF